MISLIFIVLEGFFDSVKDTLAHHYDTSVFQDLDDTFWDPSVSWKRDDWLPDWIPDALTDGWHIAKLFDICSFLLTVVFYNPMWNIGLDLQIWISSLGLVVNLGSVVNIGFDLLTLGITRSLAFNLNYKYLLIRNTNIDLRERFYDHLRDIWRWIFR